MNRLYVLFLAAVALLAVCNCSQCMTIGDAKALPSGSTVTVNGSITLLEPTECYIEATNRSAGIWVQADTTDFMLGNPVTASGNLSVVNGEQVIQGASLTTAVDAKTIASVGMPNKLFGRSTDAGISSGLLVTVWGKVNAVCYTPITGAYWFQIDDGSCVASDYGDSGVIVYSDADITEGDYVRVTGVSSVETALDDASKLVRTVRTRSSDDVQVLLEYTPKPSVYPFSDEFDSPTLDPRWEVIGNRQYASVASNPGYLALSTDPTDTDEYNPSVVQLATGDWDMEMRFTTWFSVANSTNTLYVFLRDSAHTIPVPSWTSLYRYTVAWFDCSNSVSPETAEVGLLGQSSSGLQGGQYWLRLRRRGSMLYASVSSDGVNYCTEVTGTSTSPCIEFNARGSRTNPYAFLIDYIRFSRADQ